MGKGTVGNGSKAISLQGTTIQFAYGTHAERFEQHLEQHFARLLRAVHASRAARLPPAHRRARAAGRCAGTGRGSVRTPVGGPGGRVLATGTTPPRG